MRRDWKGCARGAQDWEDTAEVYRIKGDNVNVKLVLEFVWFFFLLNTNLQCKNWEIPDETNRFGRIRLSTSLYSRWQTPENYSWCPGDLQIQKQITKQQVHKHTAEGNSRKVQTDICTTTAAAAEAAQTEQTHSGCTGSRALPKEHLLLLLLQAEHRAQRNTAWL